MDSIKFPGNPVSFVIVCSRIESSCLLLEVWFEEDQEYVRVYFDYPNRCAKQGKQNNLRSPTVDFWNRAIYVLNCVKLMQRVEDHWLVTRSSKVK